MLRKKVDIAEPLIQKIWVDQETNMIVLVFAYTGKAKTYKRCGGDWYICQGDCFARLPQEVPVRRILDQQLPKLEVN